MLLNPSVDGVVVGFSVNVWNARRRLLERVMQSKFATTFSLSFEFLFRLRNHHKIQ